MNEVFISYKREDEVRVGRLVQALESVGYSVWDYPLKEVERFLNPVIQPHPAAIELCQLI